MTKPVHVQPSNAPPQREDDSVYFDSRVLQEHSGNPQQTSFDFGGHGEKYPDVPFNENFSALGFRRPHSLLQYYHTPLLHRQAWRFGYSRGGLRHLGPEDEARIRLEADRLYTRFCKSEQFIKYRTGQTKEGKDSSEDKWPEHMEKAFIRALIQYPPMGRKKQLHKDKQRGRNELIADCIEELTGESRTRKQVSSHIQVLKPFVENDPYIMKWLVKGDKPDHHGRNHGSASVYSNGRRHAHYPVPTSHPLSGSAQAGMSQWDHQRLQKARDNGDLAIFQPVDFQMFVQQNYRTDDGHEDLRRLHTYTNSIMHPLGPDLYIQDNALLQRDYPLLAALHAQRPLECVVLDAEASLAFPTKTWKNDDGSPLPGIELGIYFLCISSFLPASAPLSAARDDGLKIMVYNTFYSNGVCVKEQSGCSEVRMEASGRPGVVETRIKFGSTFWAKTLGRLAARLLDTSRDNSEDVGVQIKAINAVQEIVAVSEYGFERLLVVHWKFRPSTAATGRTSWRKLMLPHHTVVFDGSFHSEPIVSFESHDSQLAVTSNDHYLLQPPLSATHSPYDYESSSGSATSSATWPTTSFGDDGILSQPTDFTREGHGFDFNAVSLSLSYDPSLALDSTFDSSAFNFATTVTADPFATVSLSAADPALYGYSHHQHHLHQEQQQQGWYPYFIDSHQAVTGTESFAPTPNKTEHHELDEHVHAHAHSFDTEYASHYADDAAYSSTQEQHQAFGGAGAAAAAAAAAAVNGVIGAERMTKEGNALAALANASYMASATNGEDL